MISIGVENNKLNETEIKITKNISSSQESFIVIKKQIPHSASGGEKDLISSSAERKKERDDNILESAFLNCKTEKEKEKLDRLVHGLSKELIIELQFFSMDDSELTTSERKIIDIEEQYGFRVLGEVLQSIYLSCNDYPNILAGICKGLGRFDLREVSPWGPTMLAGLLNHKSIVVKEYAVSLVENWSDVSLLPVLRNIDTKAEWLEAYINDVVDYLEEYNVLHKKVI